MENEYQINTVASVVTCDEHQGLFQFSTGTMFKGIDAVTFLTLYYENVLMHLQYVITTLPETGLHSK